ncbi:MAG: hypothetical protein LBE12_12635 [Planctomycetaceae bacterium]|jgi:hypothetical protein|nr:hypothetical protein [Planctomycetaceae bacterium]
MKYSQEELSKRNLFDWIVGDLHVQQNETYRDITDFIVFSCEPFGFNFPNKNTLKKMSDHSLARQFSKRDIARNKFDALLKDVIQIPIKDRYAFFLEKINILYCELQPWCIRIKGIDNLKKVLDDYMIGYNVRWDCDKIGNTIPKIFFIKLWIDLDTNNISEYKKIYKVH